MGTELIPSELTFFLTMEGSEYQCLQETVEDTSTKENLFLTCLFWRISYISEIIYN